MLTGAALTLSAQLALPALNPPEDREDLETIELPNLDGVETVVAGQIESAIQSVRRVIASPGRSDDTLASAYGQLGRLLHAYDLLDAAETAYGNASLLAPRILGWKHLQAHSQRQAGRLAAAAASFGAASRINPRYPAAKLWLAEIELLLGASDRAVRVLDEAMELTLESAFSSDLRGRIAKADGRFEEAVGHFENALRLAPNATRLHYSLGMAYREMGKTAEARFHLSKRGKIGVRPRDPIFEDLRMLPEGERAHSLRGRLAYQAGSYGDAVEAFRRALQAAPESPGAHVNLASALASAGDQAAAVEHFRAALELDPQQANAHFNLGSLAFGKQRYDEAAVHFAAVLESNPGDSAARRELARALSRSGRGESAIVEFRTLAEGFPSDPQARVDLAQSLIAAKRFQEALETLEAAHKRFPADAPTTLALARVLAACPDRRLRDGGRAVELARKAFAASQSVLSAETVALSLAEARRCEEAIEWQQRVVETAGDAGLARVDSYRRSLEAYRSTACRDGAVP